MSAIMGALPRYGAACRSSLYFSPSTLTRNSGTEAGAGMPTLPLLPCVFAQATYSLNDLAGVPPDTAIALTKVAKPATGTKSLAGSKPGFFTTSGNIEMVWSCDKKKVVPSGAAVLSACAAICPPAPALFSTTTVVPRSGPSFSASVRATESVPPPAGKPTISLTGPVWACSPLAHNASAAASTAPTALRRESGRAVDLRVLKNKPDIENSR